MSKWTPGPWRVVETDEGHEIRMADFEEWGGYAIHVVSYDHGEFSREAKPGTDRHDGALEAHANARLIAASPDLAEACQSALDYMEKVQPIGGEGAGVLIDTKRALRAALAKARGEDPEP